jgi:SAM-dependent methyltransferase
MNDAVPPGVRASTFFEDLWKTGDNWDLERSPFERDKYECQLALIRDRRYSRVLEIGCGGGVFTEPLAALAERVVAIDVAPSAIDRARSRVTNPAVDFRVANVMDWDPAVDGPWDLIVLSETIYYLGWLYPFFDVAWLASQLEGATRAGGRLLMANTCGGLKEYLLQPWMMRTYRDLFVNVGYRLESEKMFHGQKDGINLDVLVTLLEKPPDTAP